MNASLSLGERLPLAEGELELPRSPGIVRRFWGRHPWLTDSLVSVLYVLLSAGSVLVPISARAPVSDALAPEITFVSLQVLAVLLMAAALLFRRHRPRTVLLITWAGALTSALLGAQGEVLAVPLALYALAVYRSAREAWYALAASAVIGTVQGYLAVAVPHRDVVPLEASVVATSIQIVVIMLIATLIGVNVGNRKRYVAALVDRARQLATERDQQAQLATAAERSRIAREMHDIVSHSLTVMVTLADGSSAAVPASPDRASAAMRQVAATGRIALTDMRRMLGLLDGAAAPADGKLGPQPGVGDLDDLVQTFRAAALPVRYTASGQPPEDQSAQLAVYRIVQESLTNALRYAVGATDVAVDIEYGDSTVIVTITDDGNGVARDETDTPGHGLLGMSERVSLFGGTVESGPRNGGGWTVRAVLETGGDRR